MDGHGFGLDGSRGWASSMWAMLAEGGMWGIPRSGLFFRKEGQQFILTERMPWQLGMPFSEEEWAEAQDEEIEMLKAVFSSIGVTVMEIEL